MKKKFCPLCGSKNKIVNKFCIRCGYPLDAPTPGFQAHPQPQPPQRQQPEFITTVSPMAEEVPKAVYIPNAGDMPADISLADEFSGETMVLGALGGIPDDSETTILNQPPVYVPQAFLLRNDTAEETAVTNPQFTIGRSRAASDYCISDRTVISRTHAQIITYQGKYYVVDLNSSNKTYLNDTELVPNQSVEISSGARIRIADVEFTFFVR